MDIKSSKRFVTIGIIAVLLAGGYSAYRAFGPARADHWEWSPQGRIYTVQRSSIPLGISGRGIIQRHSDPSVTIAVRENEIKDINTGQKVSIWVRELSSNVEGSVLSISKQPRIENGSKLYDVAVSIKGGENITQGMNADVQIVLDSKKDVIVVPALAVKSETNGRKFVWVIPPGVGTQVSKAKSIKRYVEVGLIDERNAEIIKGLQEGERIVIPSMQE